MATILRSSKYVRNFAEFATKLGFTHIKPDPRVTLLSQRHYLPSSFTKSLATQAAAKTLDNNESNLEINLRKLDEDVKRYGRISKAKLERILNAFQNSKSATSTQALMVIRCCGSLVPDELPETRSQLVNQVWKSLENLGIQLDITHYNALLRVYVENEYAFSPAEVLAELERKGIEPNKLTYQRLINRYCQQGDIEGASKVLEFMREKEISINENIFTALVKGHSQANDMVSAADILSVMRQAGLEPSADTYKELLCGYAKQGDMESIMRTYSECQSRNVHLLDTDFLDVIFTLACNGQSAHIEAVLSIMPKEVGYLQDALNNMLKLVNAGQIDAAMQILFSIPNRGRGQTGTVVIKQLAKVDMPLEKLLDLCKQIESKGINSRALLIALEIKLLQGDVEASLAFLEVLDESGVEIREHYFWPIFVALGREKNNAGVNDLIRKMKIEYRQVISGETLRDYVIPNKTGEPDKMLAELIEIGLPTGSIAFAIVQNMVMQMKIKEASEFAPNYAFRYNTAIFIRPLVTALAQTKDVTSFVAILRHIYQNRFNVKSIRNEDLAVNNHIMEPYIIEAAESIKEDRPIILAKILEQLMTAGYGISDTCVATLQRTLGQEMTPHLTTLFNRLKSKNSGFISPSTLDASACHSEIARLESALEKSNSNDASVISAKKRLLYLYSRIKDLNNLTKLVAEFKEQGVQFTDSMYRQLIEAYVNSDMPDKMEEYLTALKQSDPGYILDDVKLVKYIVLLVKSNRLDDAVQFLQNQQNVPLRQTQKKRNVWWKLLHDVAELGIPQAVSTIHDLLLRNEYIEISSTNLGALVKVHIVRDDLAAALNEFEKICETYQHTPLKNELAKKLIQTEDATALQRLTDLSTQVHGETNSLYDLAQSFIECDCLRQAQKILEIPALHSKVHRLRMCSKRYSDQGMTIYSERLLAVIKNVPFYKAVPEFYNDLLSCYDKENNWQKGLSLQSQMDEEEIEPSDIFLVTLAKLLRRNNQPVSFAVPQLRERKNSSKHGSQTSGAARHSSAGEWDSPRTEDDGGNDNFETDSITPKIPRAREESRLIESLVQNGKLNAAYEILESLLDKDVYPYHRTFRFIIRRLGSAGEIELFEKLRKRLSTNMKKAVDFENNLCQAYVASDKAQEYLHILEKYVETPTESNTDVLSEFPMFGVRTILEKKPELIERYTGIAEKCAAQGNILPMNVLWIHYYLLGHPEADNIWSEYLVKVPNILFHSIIRYAQRNKNSELLKRLIMTLETGPLISADSKGFAYSELIKLYYLQGRHQESIDTLREALKVVSVENLYKNTLSQMKLHLEAKGLTVPADILVMIEAAEARE